MSSYKIAAASSDGVNIDCHFGSAESFYIYTVDESGSYSQSEIRSLDTAVLNTDEISPSVCSCRSGALMPAKVSLIADCRFLLCAAVGPGAFRQLEGAGITVFDINAPLDETVDKIIAFYKR